MSPGDLFDRILTLLHEAALDEAHWPAAARLMSEVSQTKGNTLSFGEGPYRRSETELSFAQMFVGAERREDLVQEYCRVYWRRDECIPRIKQLPPGQLAHVRDLYTDRERKTSPAYNEVHRASHMRNGISVRLDGPKGAHIVWFVSDSIAPGGWGSAQIDTISRLVPHIHQFVRVREALVNAEALGNTLAELLDNRRCGVIQIDRQGRIVEANDRARDFLRQGDGLYDPGGLLRTRHVADNEELQRLLARVVTPLGVQSSPGSMTVRRSPGETRLVLHIHPVAERESDFPAGPVAALVLVVDPEISVRIDPGIVAASLGLTPAESRLAVMVAAGHGVRAIAAKTGRTEGTVRWHLKQIFRKQGISRQADLVRRVLALDGFSKSRR